MPIITLFSCSHCKAESVVQEVSASIGYRVVEDENLVAGVERTSGMPAEKIRRAFDAGTSVFNKFTREKELAVAHLRLAASEAVARGNCIIHGLASQLIPADITHILRVALVADVAHRLSAARETGGISKNEALRLLRTQDKNSEAWIDAVHASPHMGWDPTAYDLFIPMHKITVGQASAWIEENIFKAALQPTAESLQAATDFSLAAQVEAALIREGHLVEATARQGHLTLHLHKQGLFPGRRENALKQAAHNVPGVTRVSIKASRRSHQPSIYRRHDFHLPARVLLADDKRDMVPAFSERIRSGERASVVAIDGESALHRAEEEQPEVMIIDLKMPGVDGLEVLRKVKKTQPGIEVILLTGRGSRTEEEKCRKLGAFGCLQKPVDPAKLSRMIEQAHEKIRQWRLKKGDVKEQG